MPTDPEHRRLTVYAIQDEIEGERVKDFSDILDPDKPVSAFGPVSEDEFSAQLFVLSSGERRPPWVEFLESGFGDIPQIVATDTFSAVLAIRFKYYKDRYYALTFGYSGRHMLRDNAYKRSFGLKTALNSMYPENQEGLSSDYGPIRSVTARTVSANTLHTLRQADRSTAFEDFGLDIQRDLLGSVTGTPYDQAKWGTRISGSDPLYLNRPTRFSGLGELCKQIERTSRREDYRKRFAWIDNVTSVENPVLVEELWERVIGLLKKGDIEDLELALPAIADWSAIEKFRIEAGDLVSTSLSLNAYLDSLSKSGKLQDLSFQHLKTRARLEILKDDDDPLDGWPLYRCLSGQLTFHGNTYLISQGDFYLVDPDYLDELDNHISALPEVDLGLPAAPADTHEADYNEQAALSSPDLLLLDKNTVTVRGRTTPIEICDLLTSNGEFVHVKRKLGSSQLSHLFSQGYVSAELLLTSPEYRQHVKDKILELEQAESGEDGDGRFSSLIDDQLNPSDFQVVYAIHAKWNDRSFVDALPFFSKINLRRFVNDLETMGFPVSYVRIRAEEE